MLTPGGHGEIGKQQLALAGRQLDRLAVRRPQVEPAEQRQIELLA
jgi:hypothetical protein